MSPSFKKAERGKEFKLLTSAQANGYILQCASSRLIRVRQLRIVSFINKTYKQ